MATNAANRFSLPLYLTGALFFFTPVVDIVTNVWPINLGAETWRYGAGGVGANYLISMVFGALLGSLTAAHAGHAKTLRILAIGCFVTAAILVVIVGEFSLNVLQLQRVVPDEDMAGFKIGAVKAALKYFTSAATFVVLGMSGWKMLRTSSSRSEERSAAVLMKEK